MADRLKLPFVSRAAYDLAQRAATFAHEEAVAAVERANELKDAVAFERGRYDALLDKYHALRMAGASPAPVVPAMEPIEPDAPPDVVLEAMWTISPTKDKTYEANWLYWEQNKERAAQHPEAFAEEILYGTASWQPPTRTMSTMAFTAADAEEFGKQ